jgi:hypothetical protein
VARALVPLVTRITRAMATQTAMDDLKKTIGRRLERFREQRAAEDATARERTILERAVSKLDGVRTMDEVRAWATSLVRELDKPSSREKVSVCVLLDYLRALAQRKSATLDVRVKVDDLVECQVLGWNLSDRELADMRSLKRPAELALLEVSREFLEAWYPCAPLLDRERFDVVLDADLATEVPLDELTPLEKRSEWTTTIDWETGKTQDLGQRRHVEAYAQAHGIIQELAGVEKGLCVMALSIDESIALVSLDVVRSSWNDLFDVGMAQDVLIWPLWPVQAAWALSYFHHGHVEIGRMRGKWPHRVEIVD